MLLLWYKMSLAEWLYSNDDIIWRLNSSGKNLCLTIDDAIYSNESFCEILDILDKYKIKVCFFIISGYITPENEVFLIRALKNGHQLVNHGKTNYPHCLLPYEEISNEIKHCENKIIEIYEKAEIEVPKLKFYRPGSGLLSDAIRKFTIEHNYKIVLGTNYPSDPHLPFPWFLSNFVKFKLKDNDVIIIHDRSWTVKTLEYLLPDLIKMDYKFITLNENF